MSEAGCQAGCRRPWATAITIGAGATGLIPLPDLFALAWAGGIAT